MPRNTAEPEVAPTWMSQKPFKHGEPSCTNYRYENRPLPPPPQPQEMQLSDSLSFQQPPRFYMQSPSNYLQRKLPFTTIYGSRMLQNSISKRLNSY